MEQYVQSNQSTDNIGLYAGIGAIGVAGGAALAYRASSKGKGDGVLGKLKKGRINPIDSYTPETPGALRRLFGAEVPASLPNAGVDSNIASQIASRLKDGTSPDIQHAFDTVQGVHGKDGMGSMTVDKISELIDRSGGLDNLNVTQVTSLAQDDARATRANAILQDPNSTAEMRMDAQNELDRQAKERAKIADAKAAEVAAVKAKADAEAKAKEEELKKGEGTSRYQRPASATTIETTTAPKPGTKPLSDAEKASAVKHAFEETVKPMSTPITPVTGIEPGTIPNPFKAFDPSSLPSPDVADQTIRDAFSQFQTDRTNKVPEGKALSSVREMFRNAGLNPNVTIDELNDLHADLERVEAARVAEQQRRAESNAHRDREKLDHKNLLMARLQKYKADKANGLIPPKGGSKPKSSKGFAGFIGRVARKGK